MVKIFLTRVVADFTSIQPPPILRVDACSVSPDLPCHRWKGRDTHALVTDHETPSPPVTGPDRRGSDAGTDRDRRAGRPPRPRAGAGPLAPCRVGPPLRALGPGGG